MNREWSCDARELVAVAPQRCAGTLGVDAMCALDCIPQFSDRGSPNFESLEDRAPLSKEMARNHSALLAKRAVADLARGWP